MGYSRGVKCRGLWPLSLVESKVLGAWSCIDDRLGAYVGAA